MSRIGKNPVAIPEGVTLDITDNQITVKGKLGELTQEFSAVSIKIEEGHVILERPSDHKDHKAKHGLYRALIFNMIEGVTTGWTKELELVGVGYRASNQGNKLDLALGFSHPVVYEYEKEIEITTPSPTEIVVKGISKQRVGQISAEIRAFRPPEPYKGKGVKYSDENIIRKEAKKK